MKSLQTLISERFSKDALVAFEVADRPGFAGRGFADAVAVGFWPSRGLHVRGFECKVSRSDWLRELSKPDKAERFASLCHEWWVVTTPDVVKEGELPGAWGLLEKRGDSLRVVVQAERRPDTHVVPWGFAVCIMRRLHEAAQEGRMAAAKAMTAGYRQEAERLAELKISHVREQAQKIVSRAVELERMTGIDLLYGHDVQRMAKAINGAAQLQRSIQYAEQHAEQLAITADRLREMCNKLKEDHKGEQK